MKKNYSILLLLILCTLSFNLNAQSVSLPQATIQASPMGTLENGGKTVAGFTFAESSAVNVPATVIGLPNVTISVSLQYVELTNADVSQITGNLINYFTPSYNASTNILIFEQNSEIPADWFGSVEFPVSTIQNSTAAQSFNGFNANIAAIDPSTNAQGNASSFTYTDSSVLSIDDFEALVFDVQPNPTKGMLYISLEGNTANKIQIIDVLGKVIFTKEYNNLDRIKLDIGFLQSAVYFLKVMSDTGARNTVKILKE